MIICRLNIAIILLIGIYDNLKIAQGHDIPGIIELVGYSNRRARTGGYFNTNGGKYYSSPSLSSLSSSNTQTMNKKTRADIETVKQNIDKYNSLLKLDPKNLPESQKDMLEKIVERVARLKESLDIDDEQSTTISENFNSDNNNNNNNNNSDGTIEMSTSTLGEQLQTQTQSQLQSTDSLTSLETMKPQTTQQQQQQLAASKELLAENSKENHSIEFNQNDDNNNNNDNEDNLNEQEYDANNNNNSNNSNYISTTMAGSTDSDEQIAARANNNLTPINGGGTHRPQLSTSNTNNNTKGKNRQNNTTRKPSSSSSSSSSLSSLSSMSSSSSGTKSTLKRTNSNTNGHRPSIKPTIPTMMHSSHSSNFNTIEQKIATIATIQPQNKKKQQPQQQHQDHQKHNNNYQQIDQQQQQEQNEQKQQIQEFEQQTNLDANQIQLQTQQRNPIGNINAVGNNVSPNSDLIYDSNVTTSAIIDSLAYQAREDYYGQKGNQKDKKQGTTKPTKYHYYPHNQHIYLLPECAIQQVCNAVYVRLNYTQPLCACPSRYRDPCSASLNEDDQHTTKLIGDGKKKAITLAKTCEATTEMRECRSPKDWSLLALQNTRTGKSHYLVICRCPDHFKMEGPMAHDQPTYASVPGIRVFGMMCVKPGHTIRKPSSQPPKRYQLQKPYYIPNSSNKYNLNKDNNRPSYASSSSYQQHQQETFQTQHQSNYQYLNRPGSSPISQSSYSHTEYPESGQLHTFNYGRNNERKGETPIDATEEAGSNTSSDSSTNSESTPSVTTVHDDNLTTGFGSGSGSSGSGIGTGTGTGIGTGPAIQNKREKRSLNKHYNNYLIEETMPAFPWDRLEEFQRTIVWDD